LFDSSSTATSISRSTDNSISPYSDIDETILKEIKSKEKLAIERAEQNQLDQALNILTEILDSWPHYASAYNNRYDLKGFRMRARAPSKSKARGEREG
jgi:hypothetical protein